MASLTAEAQQIMMQNPLGDPLEIYGTHTILNIIGGSFLMIFGIFWIGFIFYFDAGIYAPPPFVGIVLQLVGLFTLFQVSGSFFVPSTIGMCVLLSVPMVWPLFDHLAQRVSVGKRF